MDKVMKMQMINQYVGGMPPEIVEMIDGFIKESYEEEKKRLVYYYRKKVLKQLLETTDMILYDLNTHLEIGTDFEREAREMDKHYIIIHEGEWFIHSVSSISLHKYNRDFRRMSLQMVDGFIKESYEDEKRLVYLKREKVFKELLEKTDDIYISLDIDVHYYSINHHVDNWGFGIDCWLMTYGLKTN